MSSVHVKTALNHKIEVVDNFLPEKVYNHIHDTLSDKIDSPIFPWFYAPIVTGEQKENDNSFYFLHLFYAQDRPQSPFYELLFPLLEEVNSKALLRVKANLYPNQGVGVREHAFHQDLPFKHNGALYSLNTCDGYTRIGDEKIPSVANRIIFFDSSQPHCSTTCSDTKYRMNININYFS